MKILRIAALAFCTAALAAIAVCIFTDWNDDLFLPLGLALSAAGNILNILYNRKEIGEKENAK
ncbi:MAG: hypothetical protein ACI4NU_02245 [Christensenellales bacterium]